MSSGLAFFPAMRMAGLELGMTLKMRKTITEIAKSTAIIPVSRRATKRSMGLVLQSDLGARIECVAESVTKDVERQHREHDHEARDDGQVRCGVDGLITVGDHGAP